MKTNLEDLRQEITQHISAFDDIAVLIKGFLKTADNSTGFASSENSAEDTIQQVIYSDNVTS